MSQALSTTPISSLRVRLSSTNSKPNTNTRWSPPPRKESADADAAPLVLRTVNHSRRNIITIGIVGAVYGEKKAWAGARRAAPPPTDQEKKDPNISAVQAKVLASRKRKEAMKQAMAKQRERGKKVIEQPSNSSPSPQSEPKPEPEPELEPMPQ
ncbi:uncharacterized protein LOC130825544 [Amaranthus tricolor]|uniref:uncharacterized protein LOC130825544 n=1 Tax=Amaranthus tricolor TaxID=29722 RepID=UPI0025848D4E|nr:uncharacterized protein LOC130825544 [Amaranthus tricolor]